MTAATGGSDDDDGGNSGSDDGNGGNGGNTGDGEATFTIKVTNIGDVDLTNVVVEDPLAPNCDNIIGDLAVGAMVIYECSVEVTESFTNTATATGDAPDGTVVQDEDPADVEVINGEGCPSGDDDGNDDGHSTSGSFGGFAMTVRDGADGADDEEDDGGSGGDDDDGSDGDDSQCASGDDGDGSGGDDDEGNGTGDDDD